MKITLHKAVVACLSSADLAVIQHAARGECQVIAVALAFGNGPALRELHDAALTAGAVRCHALDVREEFARHCVVPVLGAETLSDAGVALQQRTSEFVASKLALIALLEGDAAIVPGSDSAAATARRRSSATATQSAHVTVTFDNGLPVSVNGVAMTPAEVLDSLATIAAVHGIDGETAPLRALHLAYRSLTAAASSRTGATGLLFTNASISVLEPDSPRHDAAPLVRAV